MAPACHADGLKAQSFPNFPVLSVETVERFRITEMGNPDEWLLLVGAHDIFDKHVVIKPRQAFFGVDGG
ncbi:hypothetical protein D3C72_2181130 [compost metagenome]